MSTQHLSDEAVAAFADGVLTGGARARAARHLDSCGECAHAVRVQREAAWTLRGAPVPGLPTGLLDRLRTLPQTTPLPSGPAVFGPDGSPLLPTSTLPTTALPTSAPPTTALPTAGSSHLFAPMAAFVAPRAAPAATHHRSRPIVTAAAVVALTGALSTAAVVHHDATVPDPATGVTVRQLSPGPAPGGLVNPVDVLRSFPR